LHAHASLPALAARTAFRPPMTWSAAPGDSGIEDCGVGPAAGVGLNYQCRGAGQAAWRWALRLGPRLHRDRWRWRRYGPLAERQSAAGVRWRVCVDRHRCWTGWASRLVWLDPARRNVIHASGLLFMNRHLLTTWRYRPAPAEPSDGAAGLIPMLPTAHCEVPW